MLLFTSYHLQGNFAPPPVATQPAHKPFVPANPPMLRNVEQYQQPTLGSQLYPVCSHIYNLVDSLTFAFQKLILVLVSGF